MIVDQKRCWVFEPSMQNNEGDDPSHWDTEAAADEYRLNRYHDAQECGSPAEVVRLSYTTPVQLPGPCVTVVCNGCQTVLIDGEYEHELHFTATDKSGSLTDALRAEEWTWGDDGQHHCPHCPPLRNPTTSTTDVPLLDVPGSP